MTDPSRTSVGAAIATGLALLAAVVGFSMLGGTSTEEKETRAAAAVARAAQDLEQARAGTVGCRSFTVVTTEAGIDGVLSEINDAGAVGASDPDGFGDYFYDYLDSESVLAALDSYGPALTGVAEIDLLPQEQFDAFARVLANAQSLKRGVRGVASYESVIASAVQLRAALTGAREVCASVD